MLYDILDPDVKAAIIKMLYPGKDLMTSFFFVFRKNDPSGDISE